jgi:hypothetical protein
MANITTKGDERRPMKGGISQVKLPADLVKRAEAEWDWLMEIPEFRAAAPRRSGAAAVRMLLLTKLRELEKTSEGQLKKGKRAP